MKNLSLLVFTLLFTTQLSSQTIHALTEANELYRVNVVNCTEEFVTTINAMDLTDITFHPNGDLYGILREGKIVEIDTLTGNINIAHTLPLTTADEMLFYNALTVSSEGLFYATGQHGDLYTYDLTTGEDQFLGNLGFQAAGDLTFYAEELYVSTVSRQVVLVSISNPGNSSVKINNATIDYLYGLSTFTAECEGQKTYAISNVVPSGDSRLFRVFWESVLVTELCNLNNSYFGSATTTEFLSSSPSLSVQGIDAIQPSCDLDNGSIMIFAAGGTGNLSYAIDTLDFQGESTFAGLAPGSYTVTVRDENDCTLVQEIELPMALPLEITEVVVVPTSCGDSNGTLTINANGGGGSLRYSIDDINYQASNIFENLAPAEYIVHVLDQNDCGTTTEATVADSPNLSLISLEVTDTDCGQNNGSIDLTLEGELNDLQLLVDSVSFPNLTSINDLGCGTYSLALTDQYNCTIETVAEIGEKQCNVYIPNAFSPNNDGINDYFEIYLPAQFEGSFSNFKIFSRWGELVYEIQDFAPQELKWNGTFREKKVAQGVYVYFLEFTTECGNTLLLQGDVTLLH